MFHDELFNIGKYIHLWSKYVYLCTAVYFALGTHLCMIDYKQELNPAQAEAVLYNDGPALVIAGAGSGKTRVLTYKLAHLLECGYAPEKLMALTFTNKAAREMQQRVAQMVSTQSAAKMKVGTFHSVFARILRRYAPLLGFTPNFSIYDTSDSKSLLKKIVKEFDLDTRLYTSKLILNRISTSKNRLVTPQAYNSQVEMVAYDKSNGITKIDSIYAAYVQRCKEANAMDFDDLLFLFNVLLRDFPEVQQEIQDGIDYLLIDEFQDTNPSQYLIVRRLVEQKQRLFAVGDDAQSIYSFRGANMQNILSFTQLFPQARLFKLEENYRSSQNIVNLANSLIEHNRERIPKNVFSRRLVGTKTLLNGVDSGYEEAQSVATSISHYKRQNPAVSYRSFAILYRTNAQSRLFEEQLRLAGIPYKIYGGLAFYGRAEIKNILAYLQLILNRDNNEAFERAAKYPKKGIGDKTLFFIHEKARQEGISLHRAAQKLLEEEAPLPKAGAKSLALYLQLLEEITIPPEGNFVDWVKYVVEHSGIVSALRLDNTEESEDRLDNVQEFVTSVQEFYSTVLENDLLFDPNYSTPQDLLSLFLQGISLATDRDDEEQDEEKEAVHLMTVHASKGLEYDYVYVVGLEEGLFPSSRSDLDDNIEEERRLLYVAITRAKEHCNLYFSRYRIINGNGQPMFPSRFLQDLDATLLSQEGLRPDEYRYLTPNSSSSSSSIKARLSKEKPTISPLSPLPTPKKEVLPGVISPTLSIERVVQSGEAVLPVKRAEDIALGDRVFHKLFGEGRVCAIEGTQDNAIASIEFEKIGIKQIFLRFAALKKFT